MSKFVSVHANGNKGPVVTVTEAFARSIDAKVLDDEPAVDHLDRPLPPRERGAYKNPVEPSFGPAIALPDEEPQKTPDAVPAPATTPTGGPAASQPEEATK